MFFARNLAILYHCCTIRKCCYRGIEDKDKDLKSEDIDKDKDLKSEDIDKGKGL